MSFEKNKNECCMTRGLTILELIIVLTLCGILCSFAIPALSKYCDQCSVSSAVTDIVNVIMEAKWRALCGNYHAIHFGTDGTVTLISGRGSDGQWNTGDDIVVRSFSLEQKGRGIKFGYGNYGPIPNLTAHPDGVSFDDNTAIINDDMTGSAGSVYVISPSGTAMAIVLNSNDSGYALWKWNGAQWIKR